MKSKFQEKQKTSKISESVQSRRRGIKNKNKGNVIFNNFISMHFGSKTHSFRVKKNPQVNAFLPFFSETVHPARKGIDNKNVGNCILNNFISMHFCSKYHSFPAKDDFSTTSENS